EARMTLAMPGADRTVLERRNPIVETLRTIVPGEGVIASEPAMRPFECDGLTAYRQLPMVVVLPDTSAQVGRILRYCHAEGVKVVPRGAGTSLSGGALPPADGVLRLGGKPFDTGGYDLLGIINGSEGLLGIVTEVTVRILRRPESARALLIGFPSSEDAGECVGRIIGAGIIPGGIEMMDRPAI